MRIVTLAFCILLAACDRPAPAPPLTPVPPGDAPQWVYQHAPHAPVALVFVHGIFGDAQSTWTRPGSPSFFKLVNEQPQLGSKVDIFTFGYASHKLAAGSLDIQEAADKLHERLKFHGLMDYRSVVFVAHSMGGLVVMRELLTHREMMERVPAVLFFATPQEGAQVAVIANKVANNPALEQLLPSDKNGYLSALDSEWKSVPDRQRPVIRCAYETKPYKGVMVVARDSGTRFCDGASSAISENHADIVKPDGAEHDSMVFLVNAMNDYVLGASLQPKLETPDFIRSGKELVFALQSPFGKQTARLVNAGRSQLRYTLSQVDPALYIWPADTPRTIPADGIEQLQFALGFGARAAEYSFVLQAEPGEPQTVKVRINNPQALLQQQTKLANDVSQEIQRLLVAPKADKEWGAAGDGGNAQQALLATAHETVKRAAPTLPEAGQLVLVAEVMNAASWPDLSLQALRRANALAPANARLPAAQRLASAATEQSDSLRKASPWPMQLVSAPVYAEVQHSSWKELSRLLQGFDALKPLGLRLEGKLKWLEGDTIAATKALEAANRAAPPVAVNASRSTVQVVTTSKPAASASASIPSSAAHR